MRRYNYQPVAPLGPSIPFESQPRAEPSFQEFPPLSENTFEVPVSAEAPSPIQPEAAAAPVAPDTPAEPVAVLHSAAPVFREGYEDVERPVPVQEPIPSYDAEKPIFYSDLYGLRPQRKEKIHDMSFF